jgi:hypothetical protein
VKAFLLATLFLTACASTKPLYRSPGPYLGGPLLPLGTYLQDISIEPKTGGSFQFQGVLERRAKATVISGLSPFGTTMFRITDDFKGEPKVEIFVDQLRAHADRVLGFYTGLRPLLRLNDDPAMRQREVKSRYGDRRPEDLSSEAGVNLHVKEYDREGRASDLMLSAPNFKAHIKLREYRAP